MARGVADLDQGVRQGVLQGAIGRLSGRGQQCRDGGGVAEPAQGLGGGPPVLRRGSADEGHEPRQGLPIQPDAGRMGRHLADRLVGVSQGFAGDAARRGVVDTGGGPDGVAPGLRALAVLDRLGERRDGSGPAAVELGHGAPADRRSRVVEQRGQARRVGLIPPDRQAARVGDLRRADPPDPVDRAQHVGLRELRRRTAELVPAPRVDDEHAAVGVGDDVGRVEVAVGAGEEVLVLRGEGRSARREDVAGDLLQVEAAGEDVIAVAGSEGVGVVGGQPARRGGAEVHENGHDLGAGSLVTVEDAVDLAVNAAVDGVDQAVALAAAGVDEERGGEDPLAARREHDVDRVVHAARHDRFDARAVGTGPEDV